MINYSLYLQEKFIMQKRNTRLRFRTLFLLLLPAIMASIHSCEYNSSDDNFVIVEKPNEQVQIGIDLAGVNPEKIIYIYPHTQFGYSLFTQDRDVFARQFYLDGEPIETDQYNGTCNIYASISDNNIHELKLVIALKTNSGSLAEHVGLEMYVGEFNFKIKVIPYDNKLNIKETIDSNNYLKLEWDKPENFEVSEYEIYHGNQWGGYLLHRITNPDETFFIDTDYVYGYKYYTIVAKIKNSIDVTVTDDITVNSLIMNESNFDIKRISLHEMSIKWNNPNPFPCKYVLASGNANMMIIEEGLNEAILPIPAFSTSNSSFTLYILPKTADVEQHHSYSFVSGYCFDKQLREIDIHEDFPNKQLYGLTFTNLDSYDLTSMKKSRSVKHGLNLDTGCKVQVNKEGKIAITADNSIHIYTGYTLANKISTIKDVFNRFRFVSDNKLLIKEFNGFKIYDITTNNILCSKYWDSVIEGGAINVTTTISPDGKYIYAACFESPGIYPTNEWTELYEINADGTLDFMEKTQIADIQSITFHPIKNSEAIIQFKPDKLNKFIIEDILTKEQKEIKGEFLHVDPFTGNLLMKGEEYINHEYNLYVYDNTSSEELIKIKMQNNYLISSFLFNNFLFINGHYMNLQDLKEWNQ